VLGLSGIVDAALAPCYDRASDFRGFLLYLCSPVRMTTNLTNEQLLAQAVAGDRVALERLLLDHYDRLAQRIGRQLPAEARQAFEVEDILQETFVQVFRDIRGLEPCGEQAFIGWLETIADHRLQDALRRAGRKKRGGDFQRAAEPGPLDSNWLPLVELLRGDVETPSQCAAQQEAIQAVQVGMSTLPADQREAIRMHCLERLSLEETARAMQRTPGAIRGLVQRGKVTLRACLVRSSLWFSKR
jgi:RNA polymerase sigma-70 factor (ECF subfamily)